MYGFPFVQSEMTYICYLIVFVVLRHAFGYSRAHTNSCGSIG